MRMENILMLTLAFVINVFVVCVFAEVRERGEAEAY